MKKSFIVVRFDKMSNASFKTLCYTLLLEIQNMDLETLQLQDSVGRLEKQMSSLLDQLDYNSRKMPQSSDIETLRKRLENLISSLLLILKGLERAAFDDQKAAVELCVSYVRNHFKNYPHKSNPSRFAQVELFFGKLKSNPKKKEALIELGVGRFLTEMATLQQQIQAKELDRIRYGSRMPKPGTVVASRKHILALLKYLLLTIDMKKQEHPEIDYSAVIGKLNSHLTEARAQIRNLETRKKTRKKKAEEKTNNPTNENTDEEMS